VSGFVARARNRARRFLDAVDGLGQVWRRRRARAQLDRLGAPQHVVVVCKGNICRSPYAALRLQHQLAAEGIRGVRIESAGLLHGEGRPSPDIAIEVAGRRGLDLSRHRSRRFAPHHADAQLFIVMEAWQRDEVLMRLPDHAAPHVVLLGDLDPETFARRSITDPWGRPQHVFEACFARIDRCVAAMVGRLRPPNAGFPSNV
jgi:protein-tyrosine phosphatase